MINWWLAVSNTTWIVGGAILAWFYSYDRWCRISGAPPRAGAALWFGIFLVCLGQALIGGRGWQIVGWMALGIFSAIKLRGRMSVAV